MTDDPELIDVRPDETLDTTRLVPWLREHLPHSGGPLVIRQFGGGHANLTYLVAFGDTEYVLRRPPLGPVAPSSHDMAREHRVLSHLRDTFPLAPKSFALCQDPSILGVDFHIMERRPGFVIRSELPARLERDRHLVRRLSETIVDILADLHRVDPGAVGLADLGHPEGFVSRQLDGWTRRWHAAKDQDLTSVDRVIGWLHDHLPQSVRTTLLHNDYKLDNVLLATDDPTTPTAVLDWDMCTRGDPLMDLGYLLNVWVEPTDPVSWRESTAMPSHQPGFLSRHEVVDRYARQTGFEVADVRWYFVFGVFKLIVILQQIYIRFLRGQTQDRRFADMGQRVATLGAKGVTLTTERWSTA